MGQSVRLDRRFHALIRRPACPSASLRIAHQVRHFLYSSGKSLVFQFNYPLSIIHYQFEYWPRYWPAANTLGPRAYWGSPNTALLLLEYSKSPNARSAARRIELREIAGRKCGRIKPRKCTVL